MRSTLQAAAVFLTAMALTGCGPGAEELEETPDDLAVQESSLTSFPGLTEGSADARGVLKLVNEGSAAQLTTGAGVVSRTAKSILARRDLSPLTTLAQLYAVKYVGTVSMQRLLDYARAHGYVSLDDPMPTCEGAPPAGEVVFTGGLQSTFTRTCTAAGVCTPWKAQGYAQSVRPDNGARSLLVSSQGGFYLRAQVGAGYTIEGGGTYNCRYQDSGSGSLDPLTGVGTAQLRDGYRCDISGGSGGPGGENAPRAVALKHGTTCLAISDQVVPVAGTQRKRVIVLRR